MWRENTVQSLQCFISQEYVNYQILKVEWTNLITKKCLGAEIVKSSVWKAVYMARSVQSKNGIFIIWIKTPKKPEKQNIFKSVLMVHFVWVCVCVCFIKFLFFDQSEPSKFSIKCNKQLRWNFGMLKFQTNKYRSRDWQIMILFGWATSPLSNMVDFYLQCQKEFGVIQIF